MNIDQTSRRCPECHTRTSDSATICPACGRALTSREPECCPVCGARCDDVEARCPICGAERERSAAPRVSSFAATALGLVALALVIVIGLRLRPWRNASIDPDALVAAAVGRAGPTLSLAQGAQGVPTSTLEPTLTPTGTPTTQPTPTLTPSMAPTMTPAATAELQESTDSWAVHVVARGDTPLGIALKYNVTLEALLLANGLDDDDVLSIGQELVVPSGVGGAEPVAAPAEPVIHEVASGDTLLAIARRYGVDLDDILEANGLSERSVLRVGQELEIPGTLAPAAATSAPVAVTPTPARTTLPSPMPTERPAVITHTVAKGDTLGQIGLMYGVSSDAIAAANGIRTSTVLSIGQQLVIPGVEPEPTATPTALPTATSTPTPAAVEVLSAAAANSTPRFKYGAPELLTPRHGEALSDEGGLPLLTWVSVGILEKNEWYRLRVWPTSGKVDPQVFWVTTTSWRPTLEPGVEYAWQVQVASRTLEGEIDTQLSEISSRYTFTFE